MFESLGDKLGSAFEKLRGKKSLSEEDVSVALREIRVALLEADVALPVVKDFIETIKDKAVGEELIKSVRPDQQVIKIVNDAMIEMLGGTDGETNLNLDDGHPAVLLMVGLQGSGKTTSSAKIGKLLTTKRKKKVLMASLDVNRPAAQEQLAILGEQTGVETLPIVAGQAPADITKRAIDAAKIGGFDILILDTAGRLAIDEALMSELKTVRDLAKPSETLLVSDAMTGQDAVETAKTFNERIGLTGVVLTRIDGDARGGAAMSMRGVTGKPVKLVGTGEQLDAIEEFHPERIAGRILGMGDVVSLVEKAAATIDQEQAEKMAKKFQKGKFDLEDFANQLKQMRNMGGAGAMLKMLPGLGKLAGQLEQAGVDDNAFKKQEAIMSSMTKKEKAKPEILNASRKRRIAMGSGTTVQDINKLLKQFAQMQKMMKQMKNMGMGGMMKSMRGLMGDQNMDQLISSAGMSDDEKQQLSSMGLDENLGSPQGGLGQNPFLSGGAGMPGGMPDLGGLGLGAPKSKSRFTKSSKSKRKKKK